jgi:hypothetical protein
MARKGGGLRAAKAHLGEAAWLALSPAERRSAVSAELPARDHDDVGGAREEQDDDDDSCSSNSNSPRHSAADPLDGGAEGAPTPSAGHEGGSGPSSAQHQHECPPQPQPVSTPPPASAGLEPEPEPEPCFTGPRGERQALLLPQVLESIQGQRQQQRRQQQQQQQQSHPSPKMSLRAKFEAGRTPARPAGTPDCKNKAAAAAAAAFVRRGKSTPSSGRLPDGVEAGVGDGVSSQAGRGKSRVHFGEAAQLGSGSAASVVRALLSLGGTELERRTVIVDMADDGVSPLAGDASQQQQRRHNDDRGATEQLQAVVSEAMRSSFGAVTLCTVWPHHEGVRTALVTFEAEQAALQCLEQPQTAAIQTLRERGWTAQAVPAKGSKSWTKLLSAHQI